ncbi:sigpep_I_arch, signal peptidase I [Candidatus Nanopelagicaceae bacterium]
MNNTRKASKKGSKTARYVFRGLSALFVISLVAAPTILSNYYGYGISPILSGSMRPYAEPGDAFITVKRPASELKVGDIVTLHSATSMDLYAHRIIEIRPFNGQMRIVTKGDANPTPEADPYLVSTTAEVPVTLFAVPKIGHVLVYMTSLQGRQAGLILVVVANVLALLLAMFKKKVVERNLKAEQIYKDLYDESNRKNAHEVKKMQLYKELYAESQNVLQTVKEK